MLPISWVEDGGPIFERVGVEDKDEPPLSQGGTRINLAEAFLPELLNKVLSSTDLRDGVASRLKKVPLLNKDAPDTVADLLRGALMRVDGVAIETGAGPIL